MTVRNLKVNKSIVLYKIPSKISKSFLTHSSNNVLLMARFRYLKNSLWNSAGSDLKTVVVFITYKRYVQIFKILNSFYTVHADDMKILICIC